MQPYISSNGILGGETFAVSCTTCDPSYPAYYAFDGNPNTFAAGVYQDEAPLIVYNPDPLRLYGCTLSDRGYQSIWYTSYSGRIYGSNNDDGTNMTLIYSYENKANQSHSFPENTRFFKYYYFYTDYAPYSWQPISITMQATVLTGANPYRDIVIAPAEHKYCIRY